MKAYLATTAVVFALVTAAHVFRVIVEPHVLREPIFLLTSLLAAGMCAWGARLFWVARLG